jgi:hypothetical protein
MKVRRALVSVHDKAGVVDFARELARLGVEILSTGGTAKAISISSMRRVSRAPGTRRCNSRDRRTRRWMMMLSVMALLPTMGNSLIWATRPDQSHIAKATQTRSEESPAFNIGFIHRP